VHRHTHRVVRGTLLVCGRPDGRLSALATAEAAACLSVNQASSIQSLGGTCESITIGHNPFQLPLTSRGIFLKRKRPLFLCERILVENDAKEEAKVGENDGRKRKTAAGSSAWQRLFFRWPDSSILDQSLSFHRDSSIRPSNNKRRSPGALLGAYMNIEEQSDRDRVGSDKYDAAISVEEVVETAIKERTLIDTARKLFHSMDLNKDGLLSEDEFIQGYFMLKPNLSEEQARMLFRRVDGDRNGQLDYNEFLRLVKIAHLDSGVKLPPANRDERGIIKIAPSREKYFGEILRKFNVQKSSENVDFRLARSQHFCQELYETRIASMQRFVAMTVMFHQMGRRTEQFFAKISFGLLGYRMDRTHSIMRIATTASPVSGADVRQRMKHLHLLKKVQRSIHVISLSYLRYRDRKEASRVMELERTAL
jgi:EF-hand domain pair